MTVQRAKGTRDFLPQEKIVRNTVVEVLRNIFEQYGFNPIETPTLERLDVLSAKYAGGDAILKEVFKLQDQGNRDIALRYDLTVPMCRFIAMNKGLRMPFKRYQIGRVFRDGPLKVGRYREFWQCDVDVVGCANSYGEVETLNLAKAVFQKLGLSVIIKVNDRRLLDAIVEQAGISKDKMLSVILALDKIDKIGKAAVAKELQDIVGLSESAIETFFSTVLVEGTNEEKLATLEKQLGNLPVIEDLRKLFDMVDELTFVPYLARGLAYYTGATFEVFLQDDFYGIKSSLAGGGRYDNMIGGFLQSKQQTPATGISFGLDIITDVLKRKNERENEPIRKSVVRVYVVSLGCFKESYEIVQKLRFSGLKVDIDLLERSISKNLDYANKSSIPYVVIVGKKELQAKKVTLRNMTTGEEKLLSLNDCFKLLQ